MHPFRFLLGARRLRVSRSAAGEVLNLCQAFGFVYRDFEFCEDYACFVCTPRVASRLVEECRARGIAVVEESVRGLPGLLFRYWRRAGVWVGMLLFAAILFVSGRVVWDVRVAGNTRLDDDEVLAALREQGLYVGCSKAGLDIDALENRVLLYSDEISWISVNMVGTVANVELREVEPIEIEPPEYAASNLVAARGGVIEWFEDIRGNVAVEIGEAVAQGELLVGGLYGSEGKPSHYTRARGKVFARTEREFLIEIPLEYEKKTYTGRVSVEKYLIFFEKEVKFFANSGNCGMSCDTIDMVEYFQTWGGSHLPVGIRTVRRYEYEMRPDVYSEEEAKRLAEERLLDQMAQQMPDAMLVYRKSNASLSGTAYTLRCSIECIEDIALVREIKIEGISD